MNPLLWRFAILAAIFASGFAAGVYIARSHYRPIVSGMAEAAAKERSAAAAAALKAVQDNEVIKSQLEAQHAENQKAVDDLHAAIGRLRVKLPACAPPGAPPVTPGGSADGAAGNQPLPADAQNAFDAFAGDLAEQARYADTQIENCRTMQMYLMAR